MSFGVVVGDLGLAEGDDDTLSSEVSLGFYFVVVVCHGVYCAFSGGYLNSV